MSYQTNNQGKETIHIIQIFSLHSESSLQNPNVSLQASLHTPRGHRALIRS